MGDTFGAWIVTMPNGKKHTIVCKAYALAQGIATMRYPGYSDIDLVAKSTNGDVVVVEDDGRQRVG